MHVAGLSLHDFRSYPSVDLSLSPGVSVFLGRNGQGKTNLVEAVEYLATLSSHRVATDGPLVRAGAASAVVRALVQRDGRVARAEIQIVPAGANRARLNGATLPRTRELIGLLRVVVFAPSDLALVKGDPAERRRFLDALLVARTPRLAGVRADYERVLRQRNTLLKSVGSAGRRSTAAPAGSATLEVWDEHLARAGAELLAARLQLVAQLEPYVQSAYAHVAGAAGGGADPVQLAYQTSFDRGSTDDRDALTALLLAALEQRRGEELDRGVSLVGPHRDDLVLELGSMPAKGYASHGESWSFALALKLASYELLRADGDDPVLVLDDVFAELDGDRRLRLASLVATNEQVLVTAAVAEDVPQQLSGARYEVRDATVSRVR